MLMEKSYTFDSCLIKINVFISLYSHNLIWSDWASKLKKSQNSRIIWHGVVLEVASHKEHQHVKALGSLNGLVHHLMHTVFYE